MDSTDRVYEEDEEDYQEFSTNQKKDPFRNMRNPKYCNEEVRVWDSFINKINQPAENQSYFKSKNVTNHKPITNLDMDSKQFMISISDTFSESISNNYVRDNQDRYFMNYTDSPYLLTIEEESNDDYSTGSSKSYKPCEPTLKRSCSDHTFQKSKTYSNNYHCNADELDKNSSLNVSLDRLSMISDIMPVHADPVAVTKIINFQKKISTVLNLISFELDRIPLPDGEEDLLRRQQRVLEFCTRLSRNYLYNLRRQISEIQGHIQVITNGSKTNLSRNGIILHMQAVEQKLINAYQLLLTALNAYWKHIPCSVLKYQPGKLEEILQIILQMKNICYGIKLSPEFHCSGDNEETHLGKVTEDQCTLILSKFKSSSDNNSTSRSYSAKSTPRLSPRNKRQQNKKLLSKRLSMYASDVKSKKVHPKKYRNSYLDTRDKKNSNNRGGKPQQISSQTMVKQSRFSSIKTNEKKKLDVGVKEDDIQTMIETVKSDVDEKSCQSIESITYCRKLNERSKNCDDIKEIERLNTNYLNNEQIKDENCVQEKYFTSLLPEIEDLLALAQNKDNVKKISPAFMDAFYNFIKANQNKELLNDTKDVEIEKTENNNKTSKSPLDKQDKDAQNDLTEETVQKDITTLCEIPCQINKCIKKEKLKLSISESAATFLTNYQSQYQKFIKSHPMYACGDSNENKPWEIIAWISDKLIDELMVELLENFQMDSVIDKLYELEFQEM